MNKKILIILAAIIVLGAGGFVAYQKFYKPVRLGTEGVKNGSWQELELVSKPPPSYQLKVPLYQENNFCYGASAMMIAKYWGLSEEEIQKLKQLMISGEGLRGRPAAPPIMVPAFAKFNLGSSVYLGYLEGSELNHLKMWTHSLADTTEQVKAFDSSDEALLYLKRLIASKIPVIVAIEWDLTWKEGEGEDEARNDQYAVVVGYDENNIYTNDPSPDRGSGIYSYDTADFLKRWDLRGTKARQISFIGDYGMIFLKPKE